MLRPFSLLNRALCMQLLNFFKDPSKNCNLCNQPISFSSFSFPRPENPLFNTWLTLQSSLKCTQSPFQKAKLLTKAYYRLLRGANDDSQLLDHRQLDTAAVGPASLQVGLSKKSSVGNSALTSSSTAAGKDSGAGTRGVKKSSASAIILRNSVVYHKNKEDFDRKRWQALINADVEELRKMVEGLGNTGACTLAFFKKVSI